MSHALTADDGGIYWSCGTDFALFHPFAALPGRTMCGRAREHNPRLFPAHAQLCQPEPVRAIQVSINWSLSRDDDDDQPVSTLTLCAPESCLQKSSVQVADAKPLTAELVKSWSSWSQSLSYMCVIADPAASTITAIVHMHVSVRVHAVNYPQPQMVVFLVLPTLPLLLLLRLTANTYHTR